jgi:hypothetical protein
VTVRSSFWRREGTLLKVVLWLTAALFIGIMIVTWVASERADPVLLDLETGEPIRDGTEDH